MFQRRRIAQRFSGRSTIVRYRHHDALELPNGQIVLLTDLVEGQLAVVLQLPAEPKTTEETERQIKSGVPGLGLAGWHKADMPVAATNVRFRA